MTDLNFSNHSLIRAYQRGINTTSILSVIKYGEIIHRQGLRFYHVKCDELKYFKKEIGEDIKYLVVVLSSDNTVITCYKNKNALSKIRKKKKYLSKYLN